MQFTRLALGFLFLSFTALFLTHLSGCSSKTQENTQQGVVAEVGSFQITDQHFKNQLVRFYYRTGQAVNLSPDVRKSVVDASLDRYSVVEFARDKGWAEGPEAEYEKALITRRVHMEEFERRFIHDHVTVDEKVLRELFLRVNTTLKASHLYAKNRFEADSLFQLLQDGRDFESLARDVFRNSELAGKGGDLGYFTVDEMDIAFEDRAYTMNVGDISEPVRTSHGYSIIKLTDRVTTPIITENQFANRVHEIRPIAVDQQKELATRRHLLETVASFNTDMDLLESIWEKIHEQPQNWFGFDLEAGVLALNLGEIDHEQPLITGDDFTFTVRDFIYEAYYTTKAQRERSESIRDFIEQVEAMAYRRKALDRVKDHPKFEQRFVERAIEETFYDYLLEEFDHYLASLVEMTDEVIEFEFNRNRSAYDSPLQLNLAEIIVSSEDLADEIWEKLQKGHDFTELLHRHTIDPEAKQVNGELGFIPIDRFGMMSQQLGKVRPGEFAGPFQLMTNRFVIFKCLERREAQPRTLAEARHDVEAYLRQAMKEHLREQKVREARQTYNATIFTERLNTLPIEL